jgi:hypothetical protein
MVEPAATIALLVRAVMKSELLNSASYHWVEKPSNGNDSEADEWKLNSVIIAMGA